MNINLEDEKWQGGLVDDSLTNIEKALNPSINKKSLLEQLCTSILENTKKDCYTLSNIELFYNEGLSFS